LPTTPAAAASAQLESVRSPEELAAEAAESAADRCKVLSHIAIKAGQAKRRAISELGKVILPVKKVRKRTLGVRSSRYTREISADTASGV
jgi:hypothetical protein